MAPIAALRMEQAMIVEREWRQKLAEAPPLVARSGEKLRIRLCEPKDTASVLSLAANVFASDGTHPNEPFGKVTQAKVSEWHELLGPVVKDCMERKPQLSMVVVDEDDVPVLCAVNNDMADPVSGPLSDPFPEGKLTGLALMLQTLDVLDEAAFKSLGWPKDIELGKAFHLYIAATAARLNGQGLSKGFWQCLREYAAAQGYAHLCAECTAPATQHMMAKYFGAVTHATVNYSDVMNDSTVEGKVLFQVFDLQ